MRHMARYIGLSVLVLGLALSGCREEGDDIIIIEFEVDDFPGGSVVDNNVADDGRGLSPNNQDILAVHCIPNGLTGTGMILFTTTDAPGGTGTARFYASFYDGEDLTPPAELRQPVDEDLSPDASGAVNLGTGREETGLDVSVLWLNTATNANANARARNGDAVILWSQDDLAGALDGGAGDGEDGPNLALYLSYFDRSGITSAGARFGFQEFAARLDNGISASDGTFQDDDDENVVSFTMISDGFRQGQISSAGENRNASGDQVTFDPVIVWTQNDLATNAGALAEGATILNQNDNRAFFRTLDLSDANLGAATVRAQTEMALIQTATTFGTAGGNTNAARSDSQVFVGAIRTYNNAVFFRQDDATSGNGTDTVLVANFVDATPADVVNPFTGAVEVTPAHDPTDAVNERLEDQFHMNSILGPDDGLVNQLTVFFTHATDNTDRGLFLAQFNPNDDTDANDFRNSVANGRALVSVDDPNQTDPIDGNGLGVGINLVKHVVRVARDRATLNVAYLQRSDIGDTVDFNLHLHALGLDLNESGGLDTIANRLAPPVVVSNNPAKNAFDVTGFQWQEELQGDPVQNLLDDSDVSDCPIQSDPLAMFLLWEQSGTSGTDTEDRVFVTRMTFTPLNGVSPLLAAATTTVEVPGGNGGVFEEAEMEGDLATDTRRLTGNILVFDNNDVVTGVGGSQAVVFYVRDEDGNGANDNGDDFAVAFEVNSNTAGDDIEVGATVNIDSDFTNGNVTDGSLQVITVPTAAFTGANGAFAGTTVVVLFNETREDNTSSGSSALKARVFNKATKSVAGATFDQEFSPGATADALIIDTGFSTNTTFNALAHGSTTVGIYFTQDGHLFYNEFDGITSGGFITIDGAISPQLVDNDRQDAANSTFLDLCRFPDGSCNDLSRSLAAFSRSDLDDSRLHVRRRD